MLKKILLPTILLVLGVGFWVSPNFKEIAAGVAVFLFGMLFLENGFKAFTGGLLEKLLKRTTSSLAKSVSFGILTTTVMQSSSLVSVITISFLSTGLIGLAAGIGIIFGANIGTTTGAWLVAGLGLKVKISAYAMPMLVFGVILVLQSSKNYNGIGYVLAGLGFLFLGIHFMKEGFEAFRENVDLTAYALEGFVGLMVYTGIGLLATVIMQSSHATLVLIITALASQQITYENGLALAIGSNVGTTITAIIGSLSSNYQGRRLAGAHLIFNLFTGLVAIVFIGQFIWFVDWVANIVGIRADDYTLKLAVFHTAFNVLGVALMLPLTQPLVRFLTRMISAPEDDSTKPMYLNDDVLGFPETLLEAVRKESINLYDNAAEVIIHGISLYRQNVFSEIDLKTHVRDNRKQFDFDLDKTYVTKIKALYAAIIHFISRVESDLPPEFSSQLYDLRRACGNIVQTVKEVKHLRKNMSTYIVSDNAEIRDEYNQIRLDIAELMRAINNMRTDESQSYDLHAHEVAMEERNINFNDKINQMIRNGEVSAIMATSLLNDSDYAREAMWSLSEAGSVLFDSRRREEQAADPNASDRILHDLDADDTEDQTDQTSGGYIELDEAVDTSKLLDVTGISD